MALIQRALLPTICQHQPPKAMVLFGPRRSGKTTLLRQLTLQQDVSWFDGDNPDDVNINLNLPSGGDVRTLLLSSNAIVIDEAQRVPSIGLLLKRLVDANTLLKRPVPIYATGSSSFELSAGVRESALGRIKEVNVWPLSTQELANSGSWRSTMLDIEVRMIFGMYPEICTDPENARQNLIDHCSSLLYKDLFDLSGIRFGPKLEMLVKHLAYNIGSVISYDNLSRDTGLSRNAVEDYIRLLEQCFIVKVCHSYSKNLSNELKKSKKIYFCDTGIRNAIIRNFSPLSTRADAGALWENFFFMERVKYHSLKNDFAEIYFWRTSDRNPKEVDFIEVIDQQMRAFECKLSEKAKSKAQKVFCTAYPECPLETVTPKDLMRLWQE